MNRSTLKTEYLCPACKHNHIKIARILKLDRTVRHYVLCLNCSYMGPEAANRKAALALYNDLKRED